MKKIIKSIKDMRLWGFISFVLALACGGMGMAVTIGNEGPDVRTGAEGDTTENGTAADADNSNNAADPAHPDANDRVAPGGNKNGQDLTGTQASATQITKGGLAEDEWDNEIVKFRPWNTPLLSIIRHVSKTIKTDGYVRKHMRVGGETLEATLVNEIAEGPTAVIKKTDVSGSLRPFYKGKKIYCLGVPGYKRGKQKDLEGTLTLIVTDVARNFSEITVAALNGPAVVENDVTDELDCRKVPAIPAGTILSAGTVAMSESQKLVTPENYQPREKEVYLQKKGFNIVFTEEFEKIQKKQPLKIADIKADTLVKYNICAERDYWMSPKARWNTTNEDGSVEYCYSAEGILNQITNSIAVDGNWTLPLLTAVTKMQFTEFSEHNTAYVFCGKNAMEKLLNIQLGETQRQIFDNVKQFDIDFTRYKTTFGTLDFTWCQTLDMLHMEDCMVVLDLKGLVRYVKMAPQEETNDMSKGAGEIRDAKRILYKEADCVALRGYNSIIIGPSAKINNLESGENNTGIVGVDKMPETATEGDMVVLLQEQEGYEVGVVYIYKSGAWAKSTGVTDGN